MLSLTHQLHTSTSMSDHAVLKILYMLIRSYKVLISYLLLACRDNGKVEYPIPSSYVSP